MDAAVAALAPALQPLFTLWGSSVTGLELLAFVLALGTVIMNIRVNPLGWPLAIVSSLLYVGLFWNSRLYGDAALQIFFAIVSVWGWWQWLRGTQDDGRPLDVRTLPLRGRIGAVAALLVTWPATGWFLLHYTDTDVPWWDAFPTAASVIGQWLLGRKYIENWPTWLVVNVVSVGLFAYKALWLTAVLYGVFLVLACVGWQAWRHRLPGAAT